MSAPDRLDFGDPSAVREWIAWLRVAFDDAAGVTEDALRPLRKRDLGHVEHRRIFTAAKKQIADLLDYADPPAPTTPPGGPANDDALPERERDEALASLGAEVIAHRALRSAWTETRAENDRLRAEVERLRAGPPPNDTRVPDDPAVVEP